MSVNTNQINLIPRTTKLIFVIMWNNLNSRKELETDRIYFYFIKKNMSARWHVGRLVELNVHDMNYRCCFRSIYLRFYISHNFNFTSSKWSKFCTFKQNFIEIYNWIYLNFVIFLKILFASIYLIYQHLTHY